MESLGERLKYARKLKGFTQVSLSDAIGVSRGVIFNIEKSKAEPQTIVINAICKELNINKDWLLSGFGEMENIDEDSRRIKILSDLYDISEKLSDDELLYLLDVIKAMKTHLVKENLHETLSNINPSDNVEISDKLDDDEIIDF